MSNDIDSVYVYENRRKEQIKELSQLVGVTALSFAVTPITMLKSVTKSFSSVLSEKIQSFGAYIDDKNEVIAQPVPFQQASMILPNQLLSHIVDVTRTENPLISEARRF